jgi:hypothetical protein
LRDVFAPTDAGETIEIERKGSIFLRLGRLRVELYKSIPHLLVYSMWIHVESDSTAICANTLLDMNNRAIRAFQRSPIFDQSLHELTSLNSQPCLHLGVGHQMERGDSTIRDLYLIGAEMERAGMAVLEVAGSKLPLE